MRCEGTGLERVRLRRPALVRAARPRDNLSWTLPVKLGRRAELSRRSADANRRIRVSNHKRGPRPPQKRRDAVLALLEPEPEGVPKQQQQQQPPLEAPLLLMVLLWLLLWLLRRRGAKC